MAASEVLELVARLRPEGADETTEALEEVEESFEETADTAEQSADDLEGFSNRFEGAVSVAAGALAVAAGGLLSTVPLVADAFAGVGAIIDAFGLQIDQLLRDLGAGGIVGALFKTADSIASLEGAIGTIVGTFSAWAAGVAIVIGSVLGLVTVLGSASAAVEVLVAAFTPIIVIAAEIVAALSAVTVGLAVLLAAVVAFAAAYITNFRGIRDTTNRILSELPIRIPEAFRLGFELALNVVKQGGNLLIGAWEMILNTIASAVTEGINGIVSTIVSGVNKAIRALNKLEGVNISTVGFGGIEGPGQISLGRLETRSNQAIIRESQRRLQNRLAAQRGGDANQELIETLKQLQRAKENPPDVVLDGRKVSGGTAEYRGQNAAFRGR